MLDTKKEFTKLNACGYRVVGTTNDSVLVENGGLYTVLHYDPDTSSWGSDMGGHYDGALLAVENAHYWGPLSYFTQFRGAHSVEDLVSDIRGLVAGYNTARYDDARDDLAVSIKDSAIRLLMSLGASDELAEEVVRWGS